MEKVVIFVICALIAVISEASDTIPALLKHTRGIQLKNNGKTRLWIELTGEDNFILPAGQKASLLFEEDWRGTVVARVEECQFNKCNSPYTTAEIMFGGESKEDKYRVSLIHGYNNAIKIEAIEPNSFCRSSYCNINLEKECPETHQERDEDKNIVACKPNFDVFEKLCPHASVSNSDKETISCKTSNSYSVSFN